MLFQFRHFPSKLKKDRIAPKCNFRPITFILVVCLDLSKAFDMAGHSILPHKFAHNDITGPPDLWFRSYLLQRRQYVQIGNHNSSYRNTQHGVPQGLKSGPLLFLLYFNDIVNSYITLCRWQQLHAPGIYINDLIRIIKSDLLAVSKWLASNKIIHIIMKSHYVIFNRNKQFPEEMPPLILFSSVLSKNQ